MPNSGRPKSQLTYMTHLAWLIGCERRIVHNVPSVKHRMLLPNLMTTWHIPSLTNMKAPPIGLCKWKLLGSLHGIACGRVGGLPAGPARGLNLKGIVSFCVCCFVFCGGFLWFPPSQRGKAEWGGRKPHPLLPASKWFVALGTLRTSRRVAQVGTHPRCYAGVADACGAK